jgi:Arc/MetJ family transcription regulator
LVFQIYTSRCIMVYMGRTNVVVDDTLVEAVMTRYRLASKREAIDFALKKAIGGVMTKEQALAMRGYGWDGDLEEIRGPMVIEEWG